MKKLIILLICINTVNAYELSTIQNSEPSILGGGGSQPVATGFTYQGKLIENGQVVNSPRVFTFSLYDSSIGGIQLGSTLEYGTTIFPGNEPGYPVNNSLFFIEDMNFGDQYDGSKVWLEITVRTPNLENCGPPNPPCSIAEILSPRQEIKAVPYAVQADYLGANGAIDGDILTFDGNEWLPESPPSQPWGTVGVGGGNNYIRYIGGDIRVINGGASIGSENVPPLNGIDVVGITHLHSGTAIGSSTNPPVNGLDVTGRTLLNSGTSIGSSISPPTNGLDVTGITRLHDNTFIGFSTIEFPTYSESLSIRANSSSQALRLLGNSTNFSNARIKFGDNENVYLGENLDEQLTLHASQGISIDNNLIVQGETILNDNLLINGHVGINTGSTASNILQAAVHIESTSVEGRALFASSTIGQYTPDIVLGGTGSGNTQDEGVISSDTRYAGSDIWLMTNDSLVVRLDQDDNSNGDFQIRNGSDTTVFDVNEVGRVRQNGTTIHTSDKRLKKDIEDLPYGLAEIMVMQPKAYNWKSHKQKNKSFGLIAQDIQKIIPEIVDVGIDKDKTLGLSYTELIPVLIKAMQEQQVIIEALTDKVDLLTEQKQY